MRALPGATELTSRELRDHLPQLLDRIIEAAADGARSAPIGGLPDTHALARLDEGFALTEVAAELSLLRRTFYALVVEDRVSLAIHELALFDDTLDNTLQGSISRFITARDRTLHALDAISSAALQAMDVDTFLPKLARAFMDTHPAADTLAIVLREGDGFRLRATVGLEDELDHGLFLGPEQGFAAKLVAARRPLLARPPEIEEVVVSRALKQRGLRSLYGAPLLHGEEIVGVALLGSRSAPDFSEEDRTLFGVMCERATALIVQAQLADSERTARRAAEEAVQQLAQSQEEVRRGAEFQERILAVVSHDLRTPLQAILLAAHLLSRAEELPPRLGRPLARINDAADRMSRMVEQLLDYARTRSGATMPITRAPVDLGALARHVVDEIALSRSDAPLEVSVQGDVSGLFDGDRLMQVVQNLVTNALAHGTPDTPVRIRVEGEDGTVKLTVSNRGEPLPEELLPRLFGAFERGPSRARGLGLGLYIVQEIVRAHGGDVRARSTNGQTEFEVRLPREQPAHPPGPDLH